MIKTALKDFPTLVGKRVKLTSNNVVYEGRVTKVESDYVHLDAGIRDVRLIRLDRRIMSPHNTFLYVKETQ